ncbi:MAG: LysR family transcriptional regulator [Deltaproteobacteria bacterium]|jgi:predicted thioesterase|nr:LysR family transcriptional regulator [Deltaproteobacteria bacterium]
MKTELRPGITKSKEIVVDRARTVDFMGEELRVYATPELVRDFEVLCRELLLDYVDAGEDSVGTGISVTHSGATMLGGKVTVTATIRQVNGRQVTFELLGRDEHKEISRGEHGRFVVEKAKLRSRLAAEAARAKPAG